MLTGEKVIKKVTRRLRYLQLPAEVSPLDLLNDAGWWLIGAREWKWLDREPALVDLIQDQAYIELPEDLASVVSLVENDNSGQTIQLTSLFSVQQARRNLGVDRGGFMAALVFPDTDTSAALKQPRLEIWPVPSEDTPQAFSVVYRAGWKRLTNVNENILVPRWLEHAYVETCVAFAAGQEQEAGGTVDQRLEVVDKLLMSAEVIDGGVQQNYDAPIGGAAGEARGAYTFFGDFLPPPEVDN